jgi:hypothetical protein
VTWAPTSVYRRHLLPDRESLNTVMDFAQLQADSVSPTPEHVDLGTLAQSVVNEFSYQIERKALLLARGPSTTKARPPTKETGLWEFGEKPDSRLRSAPGRHIGPTESNVVA